MNGKPTKPEDHLLENGDPEVNFEQLQEQLKAAPWRHTYDGIPLIEFGDEGEWLMTIGHVDKTAFVNACDAYYRDVRGEPIWRNDDVDPVPVAVRAERLAFLVADTRHRKARIVKQEEFPHGDWEVHFGEGDIPVTGLAVY